MALTTFTAGQVLTAAQVNAVQANDYNQTVSTKTVSYVLVAADKGTRVVMDSATATTITVNTSLFNAGDTLFIQNIGAGVCTITAGTATVSTLGSLALAQFGSGTLYFTSAGVSIFYPSAGVASGLTLIKTQTIGTAVASVVVSDVFSATYDNYLITIAGGVVSATNELTIQLNGITTSVYTSNLQYNSYGANTPLAASATAAAWQWCGNGSTDNITSRVEVAAPFLTKVKSYTSKYTALISGGIAGMSQGFCNSTLSATGFTFITSSGTMTGGTIRVYGYQN